MIRVVCFYIFHESVYVIESGEKLPTVERVIYDCVLCKY